MSVRAKALSHAALPEEDDKSSGALGVSRSGVLLRVEGVSKAFGGQVVLDGVDLELREGEVILLRGENGSGKTTLLNILTGNLDADAGAIHYLIDSTPRFWTFPRGWWQELNPFDHFTPEFVAREGVGRTWQGVRLFDSQSLRDNIAVAASAGPDETPWRALFSPGTSSQREAAIVDQADAILGRLGLAGRENSSADKISLGQSKRVAIARAVSAGTRVLFLDEPLAGLDLKGIREVIGLLRSLIDDRGIALVIVEHVLNQSHLDTLVTTDWLLANGRISRSSVKRGIESNAGIPPASPSTSAMPPPAWISLVAGKDAEIVDEPLAHGALLTRIRRVGTYKGERRPVLELLNLVVKRGSRTIIGADADNNPAGFGFTLHEGEIGILQAPNGWGKTTLFDAIVGLIDAERGQILLRERAVERLPTWDRVRLGIRALRSNDQIFPNLTVREALALAGTTREIDELATLLDRECSSLSGGQQQLLAVLCQINSRVENVLQMYDEPFSMLDSKTMHKIAELIGSRSRGATLITVPSHIDQEGWKP